MCAARTTKKSAAASSASTNSTATTSSATTNSVTAEQMAPPPPQAVATDADTRTAAGVATLGLVQQARLSRLNRAAATAVATYGQGSSQAAAAQEAVAATQTASSRLTMLHQQLTTTPPTVATAGWALHGRVYDSNLNPLASYTVFLVDSQNNYLSDCGFSYTDATGYFLINYDGTAATPQSSTASQTSAGAPAGQPTSTPSSTTSGSSSQDSTSSGSSAQSSTTPAAAQDAAPPQAFLQIADDKANPVLLSTTAFEPSTGQATYQMVTIPAGAAPLGDPPAQVRAAALPPTKPAN
jgi:hypothetical protein